MFEKRFNPGLTTLVDTTFEKRFNPGLTTIVDRMFEKRFNPGKLHWLIECLRRGLIPV